MDRNYNEITNLKVNGENTDLVSRFIVIEDEFNLNPDEAKIIVERAQENCSLIILGDLHNENEENDEFEEYIDLYKKHLEIENNRYR